MFLKKSYYMKNFNSFKIGINNGPVTIVFTGEL